MPNRRKSLFASSTDGSRTHRRSRRFELRRFAGLRTVLSCPASPMGFEPTISCVTGRRALRAAPRGRVVMSVAQVGLEGHSIPGSKPRWSADCLPSHVSSRRKERESNPQGCEARPDSSGVPSPFGLPFHCIKAAAAGIEPASGRLTVAFPYQHRTHRIVSFSQDGRIRTGDLVRPRHAEYQAFPRPEPRAPSGS